MACPCVVIVDSADQNLADRASLLVQDEVRRIEKKYTRYQPSVLTRINESAGTIVTVDGETADLLDYANYCHTLSGGLFDITSGAFRRVWKFGPHSRLPTSDEVSRVLPSVGWSRVHWSRPQLTLEPGMELDFGGFGKEYAVDRAIAIAQQHIDAPLMVNLGGDLRVTGQRANGCAWKVGVDDVLTPGFVSALLELKSGALATSGDTYRRIENAGRIYGHVIDPRSGWPVEGAPRAVTVYAKTCSEAGLLAKLALLKGAHAEAFLYAEDIRAWVTR